MSTKTKKMKLPAWFPPLPPVAAGFDAWQYKGQGYQSKRPECFAHASQECPWWDVETNVLAIGKQCTSLHYIVAVKLPKLAKKRPRAMAVNARLMWLCDDGILWAGNATKPNGRWIYTIKKSDVSALVEQAAIALGKSLGGWSDLNKNDKDFNRASARTVLSSLGIIPKRKAK